MTYAWPDPHSSIIHNERNARHTLRMDRTWWCARGSAPRGSTRPVTGAFFVVPAHSTHTHVHKSIGRGPLSIYLSVYLSISSSSREQRGGRGVTYHLSNQPLTDSLTRSIYLPGRHPTAHSTHFLNAFHTRLGAAPSCGRPPSPSSSPWCGTPTRKEGVRAAALAGIARRRRSRRSRRSSHGEQRLA